MEKIGLGPLRQLALKPGTKKIADGVGVKVAVWVGVSVGVARIRIGLGPTCTGLAQIPGAWVVKENTLEAGPSVVSLIGVIFQ